MGAPRVRRVRVALACALALLLAALAACSRSDARDDEFRIGLLIPMSVSPAFETSRRAAEALAARVNEGGGLEVGGRRLKVRLLVEDTGGQVEGVMAATARLIRKERVSALVGPYFSRDALPVVDVAEQSHVPLVSPSASNPLLTKGRNYIFRVCMVDTVQGRALARFAYQDLGLRRAAVLYDEADAYPSGLADQFSENFLALGGQLVARETYATGAEDFRAQLSRITASGAQLLFLPNFPADLVRQMTQARAAGYAGVFLGGDAWDMDNSTRSLPQAEGAFFSSDYSGRPRKQAQGLGAALGLDLDKNAALTLDALGVVLAAANAAGSVDPVSLKAGLASLRGYEGLTGRLSFGHGGDATRSVNILVIEGGQAKGRKELEPGP